MKEINKIIFLQFYPEKIVMLTEITWRSIINCMILFIINTYIPEIFLYHKFQWYTLGVIGMLWLTIPVYRYFKEIMPMLNRIKQLKEVSQ